jgi:putative ABC transport system substrate-binding protein
MVTLDAHLSLDFKLPTTIPIVTIAFVPVALGIVPSIARPGGNITGVSIAGGFEIIGKRMGLLVEAIPELTTLGYLASRPYWDDKKRGGSARGSQPGGHSS